jgi:outer membrane protein OmpA-like peptidoglycan-associated protein
MQSLSLQSREESAPVRATSRAFGLVVVLLLVLLGGLAALSYVLLRRLGSVEGQLAATVAKSEETANLARSAAARADAAEFAARKAAEGRVVAEAETANARQEADVARQDATVARDTAAKAREEAEAIRKKAQAEVSRLEAALGQIAETRRTALGLVMNLGEDHLKFAFDKADLRPQDRELLARIAGILLTSHDYTISVNGHTDDVGSAEYNKKLSQRRAQAVRDYLVQAGLPPDILSVEGHGKSLPLVRGTTDAARAKNRRVELGLVNTQIRYGVEAGR